jgi:hypothetical protein
VKSESVCREQKAVDAVSIATFGRVVGYTRNGDNRS